MIMLSKPIIEFNKSFLFVASSCENSIYHAVARSKPFILIITTCSHDMTDETPPTLSLPPRTSTYGFLARVDDFEFTFLSEFSYETLIHVIVMRKRWFIIHPADNGLFLVLNVDLRMSYGKLVGRLTGWAGELGR